MASLMSKKIPAILGVILLLGGLVAAILVVGQSQGLLTKAGPTSVPKQVKITNVKEDSFTVSWISDTRVTGFVKYGEEAGKLPRTLADDRDQLSGSAEMYTTHYVTLKGLRPNTEYFFKIGSGSRTYGENDTETDYRVKTGGAIADKPAVDVISGKVLLATGQPAPGVIVYVDIQGGNTLSALTKTTGTWTLTLSNMRTADLSSYLAYDPASSQLTILVQGADLGTATAVVTTKDDSPVADITMGQNLDLKTSLEITVKTIEIQDNAFSSQRLEVIPGEAVTVINKDGVPHSVTAKDKEFDTGLISGGGNATFVAPSTVGEYSFSDTANPGVESLTGVLVVKQAVVTSTAGRGFGELIDTTAAAEATLSVKLLNPETPGEDVATESPEIIIQGPEDTVVKVTVNSQQAQTTQLTIDADGIMSWTPPADLEPGEHTVTIEYTDENGVLQRIVRNFTVLASTGADLPAFSATPSATPTSTPSATPTASPSSTPRSTMPSTESGVPESGVLTLTLAILMMGVGLFFGGLLLQVQLLKTRK